MVCSTALFILLCISLPFASTIKCYVGEQESRNGVLEKENMMIVECPASSYCVSQEWWLNDVKMVGLFCDPNFDMFGNYVALCKADGIFNSTGWNNVQCMNKCCSSDYCNHPTSSAGPTSSTGIPGDHILILLVLVILYKNL